MSHRFRFRIAWATALLGLSLGATAQVPELFKNADLKLGE